MSVTNQINTYLLSPIVAILNTLFCSECTSMRHHAADGLTDSREIHNHGLYGVNCDLVYRCREGCHLDLTSGRCSPEACPGKQATWCGEVVGHWSREINGEPFITWCQQEYLCCRICVSTMCLYQVHLRVHCTYWIYTLVNIQNIAINLIWIKINIIIYSFNLNTTL